MPKTILFKVHVLGIDGQVQSRERLRASLETWPEICAEVEWPKIQKNLQEFRRRRGLHCLVKYHNSHNACLRWRVGPCSMEVQR